MKNFGKTLATILTFTTGALLVFIGLRFFIVPEAAEKAFGINISTSGNHSFHFIKAARDLFTGLVVILLLAVKQHKALGIALLCGTLVPATDFMIVFSQAGSWTAALYPHLTAVLLCIGLGFYYLLPRSAGRPV